MITNRLAQFPPKHMVRAAGIMRAWARYGVPEDFHMDRVQLISDSLENKVVVINSCGQVLELVHGCLEFKKELVG